MKKIFLIATLLIGQFTFAAVVNDECAGAILLTPGLTCTNYAGTIQGTTTSAATTPGCSMYFDLFYKFVAMSPSATITVSPRSGLSMKVTLLDDCAGTALYCSSSLSYGSPATIAAKNLIVGNTYYIKTGSNSTSNPYLTFNICVVSSPNDELSTAIVVTPAIGCTYKAGSLLNATTSATTPSCLSYNDVFYKFTATGNFVKITAAPTATTSTLDLIVSTFDDSSPTAINCTDDQGAGFTESFSMNNLITGKTYYIKIASKTDEPINKTFNLCVQNPAVNDECANATIITPSSSTATTNGTLFNSSLSSAIASCTAQSDVFYKFTANAVTTVINVVPSTGLNAIVSVSESCGGTSIICANNNSSGEAETISLNSLVIGKTYYINVGSVDAVSSAFTFTISAQIPPANDNCSTATSLSGSTACTTVSGTLNQATVSNLSSICGGYDDVFYKFTATATTSKIKVTPATGLDIGVSVFPSCNANSALYCVNDTPVSSAENIALSNLIPGTVYYIKVASIDIASAVKTFNICITTPPSNDECIGSQLISPPSSNCSYNSGNLQAATNSTITSSCTSYNDVFFKFVANAPAATVNVSTPANLDLVVSVLSSCGGTEITCSNNTGLKQEENIFLTGLTTGSTYYIRVGSAIINPAETNFYVCVLSPPYNDECTASQYVNLNAAPISSSFKNTSPSTTSTTNCTTYDDLYFYSSASSTGVEITITPDTDLDVILSIYSSCGGALIKCINSGGAGQVETTTIPTQLYDQFYVKVSNALPEHTNKSFKIGMVSKNNDEKEFAKTLSAAAWCDNNIILTNATQSPDKMSCDNSTDIRFNFNHDVWYKFVATSTSYIVSASRTLSNSYGVELTNSSGVSLLCETGAIQAGSGSFAATLRKQINTLSIGDTYYVRIGNDGLGNTNEIFRLCVTPATPPIPPPANDNCTGATALTVDAAETAGTLNKATNSTTSSTCRTYNDVFYTFTAQGTSHKINVDSDISLDITLSVYPSCGSASLNCANDGGNGVSESLTLTNLTPGQNYIIQLGNAGSNPTGLSTATFKVSVESVTPPPINDECSAAAALTIDAAASAGTLNKATSSTSTTMCQSYYDVFYNFTAQGTSYKISAVPDVNLDISVSVFPSCGGTLVNCANNASAGETEDLTLTNLTPGQQYFIQIGNAGANPNAGAVPTFTVQVNNAIATDLTASELEEMNIFPNPASNKLTLKTSLTGNKVVEIISLSGHNLLEATFNDSTSTLNLDSVPQGMYLLRLTDSDGNTIVRKISILKY